MALTILLISIIIISIGFNVFLIKRLEVFLNKIEELELFISSVETEVNETYAELKSIDDRQMFEKDDDVGFVFENILYLIKKLQSRTEYEKTTEKEKK